LVAAGTPDSLKAELGSDAITVGLQPQEHLAARAALTSLPGLDYVADAGEGLAVYVQDGASAVADVVRSLVDVGIRPGTVTLARPTLDGVFLASTGRRIEGGAPEAAA
jgi:ABC-2 type transport system ATP-binding protein